MKLCLVAVSVVFLGAVACARAADDQTVFIPRLTKVALLPVVSKTGEKWAELRREQVSRGNEELGKQFLDRGFKLVDSSAVSKAVADLKLDFADPEDWKKDNLYKVAEATGADLIAFVVIVDSDSTTAGSWAITVQEGDSAIKMWLLDGKKRQPVFSARTVGSKSDTFSATASGDKGSKRQVSTVLACIRNALKDFMKPYPLITKEEQHK